MPAVGTRVALIVAAFVLATATYVLVEKPIRFGTALRRYRIPALAAASLAIGAIGFVAFVRGGIPERFPPEVRALANFKYEYKTDARYPDCWLSKDQPFDGFASFCAGDAAGRDLAVLWGDSHAARLYPGLAAALGDRVALAQFTRDSCLPALAIAYAVCQQSNAWVVGEIARLQPKVVILFASWTHYQVDWKDASASKTSLLATIDALRLAGVPKIVVVGPAPVWGGGLPRLAYQAWLDARPFHAVPEYLGGGRDLGVMAADADMRSEVEARGAGYFSMMDVFCNERGCLTHVPEGESRLVTWDSGHLTTEGATLVGRRIVAAGLLP
jgi:hypothetical protein